MISSLVTIADEIWCSFLQIELNEMNDILQKTFSNVLSFRITF